MVTEVRQCHTGKQYNRFNIQHLEPLVLINRNSSTSTTLNVDYIIFSHIRAVEKYMLMHSVFVGQRRDPLRVCFAFVIAFTYYTLTTWPPHAIRAITGPGLGYIKT